MALAERLDELLAGLPRDWESARLEVRVEDEADAGRAGVILGPATPGRSGAGSYRLDVRRRRDQPGPGPDLARRVLARLDSEGVAGRLTLVGADVGAGPPARERRTPLATAWEELVGRLPDDWSHLQAEVELDSSDYLDRGALLLAPLNPWRLGERSTLCFRSARRSGYGASPGMVRRALERLDEQGMTGALGLLRVVSGAQLVATQGPVWRVGGRAV